MYGAKCGWRCVRVSKNVSCVSKTCGFHSYLLAIASVSAKEQQEPAMCRRWGRASKTYDSATVVFQEWKVQRVCPQLNCKRECARPPGHPSSEDVTCDGHGQVFEKRLCKANERCNYRRTFVFYSPHLVWGSNFDVRRLAPAACSSVAQTFWTR